MRRILATFAIALCACAPPLEVDLSGPTAGWPEYGGAKGGGHYSPLTQITVDNVDRLEVAWTYHTGDLFVANGGIAPAAPSRRRRSW